MCNMGRGAPPSDGADRDVLRGDDGGAIVRARVLERCRWLVRQRFILESFRRDFPFYRFFQYDSVSGILL